MTLGSWLRIAAVVIAVVLGTSVYFAWRGAQREQAQLKAELQATQKALADADARQQSRNSELAQVVAQLNEKKATVQSPAQIVKALPDVLPLPTPLTLPTQTDGAGVPAIQEAPSSPSSPRTPSCSCPPKT